MSIKTYAGQGHRDRNVMFCFKIFSFTSKLKLVKRHKIEDENA